jgi:hypothetical protein
MILQCYTKARLLSISHESFINELEANGVNYDPIHFTGSYLYGCIKHPVSGEHALVVNDPTYLPEVFKTRLTDDEIARDEGWFEVPIVEDIEYIEMPVEEPPVIEENEEVPINE